ncbi:MAG: TonB-dependent receptor [Acidobacteriia bacterium]|nr:TonB-dependent receptor [Terriglobia bacterium]
MQRRMIVLLAGLVVLLWAATSFGQEITGSIIGTVKDPSGAVIPGATITVTNTDKNAVIRTTTSGSEGEFVLTTLPIGNYSITVEATGFKKSTQTGIQLHVNDKLTINIALEVGNVAQQVTVEASPVQVELQSATAAGLISGTQVRELSLNNRNYEQLVTLMPGVASNADDQIYIGTTNPSGQTNVVSYSINGSRNSANNWTVDGADNVDRGSNLTLLNYPSIDAIAEFKVLRGLYAADSGRAGAGQINVVTKSGGAQFHGDFYEFFRNNVLAANNFLNNANRVNLGADGRARVPPLRYNDFGYTIGGPVYIPGHYNLNKDKTFFFFSEEFRRVITYGTGTATVPTSAEKSGVFTSPVCIAFSGTTCTQTGTTITNINPIAAQYIKDIFSKIPDPQDPVSHVLTSALRNQFNARQELIRIDQVFGPKLTVFGRYLQDSIPTLEPGGLFTGIFLPGVATTSTNSPGRSVVIHAASALSPTLLNEAGFAYSYGAILSTPIGVDGSANSPDIKPTLPFAVTLGRVPSIVLSGIQTVVGGFGPYKDYNRNYNIYDNVSKTWGRHTLKFGIAYNHYQKTENAGGNNVGSFTFANTGRPTGSTTFQQDWANFLIGNVSSFTQASLDLTPDIRQHQWEFFVQDDLRFRPNLTFSLGLRYSMFRQPIDANGMLTNFNPATYSLANAPQIDPTTGNILNPSSTPPTNGIIIGGKGSPFGDKISNENNRNFAPRVGMAWDPFGDGKTSIRTGYGIFFDSGLVGILEQNIFANPPFVQNISIPNTQFGNPAAGIPSISASPLTLHGTPLPSHTPYVQQWSLDVQREIMKNLILDVGYYGSQGIHLLGIVDINTAPVGAGYAAGLLADKPPGTIFTSATDARLNAVRPFRGYAAINNLEDGLYSNYHSMQVAVQKRFSGNSMINFNYTWSHAMTDAQTDRSSAPQNANNIRGGEYGPSQLDRRHVFTANYVYEIPFYKDQQGAVGHLLGGWQVSGITTFYTGLPLTVTTSGTDPGGLGILGSSAASSRPDMVGDPNSGGLRNRTNWFNTAAFANVPNGVFRPGNAGRGVVRGPGVQRWDFSVFKNIKIRENFRAQFRTEMFNVFNHANPNGVNTSFTSGTAFGTITSYRDPRIIQFAIKFMF